MNVFLESKMKIVYVIKFVIFLILSYIANNLFSINYYASESIVFAYEKICLMIVFLGVMFIGLLKFEKLVAEYRKQFTKRSIVWAVAVSVSVILSFNPLLSENTTVNSFTRIIGIGMISDIDVEKIISNFMCFFFLFVVLFSASLLLMNYLRNRALAADDNCTKGLDILFEIAFVNMLLNITSFFSREQSGLSALNYSLDLLFLLIVVHILFIVLKLNEKVDYSSYQRMICIIICFSFPIAIVLGKGKLIKTYFFTAVVLVGICIILMKVVLKNINGNILQVGVFFSAFCLPLTSVYIELINVLNQYQVFISNPLLLYIVVMFIFFLCVAGYVGITKKKADDWKKIVYPSIILGVSCLSVQLSLQSIVNADIFEKANSSVLISDFLLYGKIPIVEHYGGHMLTDVLDGIVYGLLNNDFSGAIFSPYSQIIVPVICIIFYYVLSKITDKEYALLIILCLPFCGEWLYWGLGLISYLAIVSFVRRNSYRNALIIWITCGINALYRLDLGVAFDVSVVIILIVYLFIQRDKKALKMIVSTFCSVIMLVGVIWCLLCIVKDINPIDRLKEFLSISASNINWAYGNLGDVNRFVFAWSYFFIPLCVVLGMLYIVCSRRFRIEIGDEKIILLLMLGISYLINFSRSCVRHSVYEMQFRIIFWTAYLFIAIFTMCILKKKCWLIISFGFLLVLNTLFTNAGNVSMNLIVDNSLMKIQDITGTWHKNSDDNKTIWEKLSDKRQSVERFVLADEMDTQITVVDNILDILLNEEQTYLDFVNKSFMYSVMNRENPVYVAQSPGHLSGEYTQEQFIKQVEMKEKKIPIVIMPAKQDLSGQYLEIELDAIANNMRYYKVAEYIYQNYRPLCLVSDVAIWCDVDRYNELQEKLLNDNTVYDSYSLCDWGYDAADEVAEGEEIKRSYCGQLHNYNLINLPFVWANYDELHAVENNIQARLNSQNDELFLIDDVNNIQKEKGNYLLITANDACRETENHYHAVTLQLGTYQDGKFVEKCVVTFNAKPGKQNYLIRLSADYYWYINEINAIKVINNSVLEDIEMAILEGD